MKEIKLLGRYAYMFQNETSRREYFIVPEGFTENTIVQIRRIRIGGVVTDKHIGRWIMKDAKFI